MAKAKKRTKVVKTRASHGAKKAKHAVKVAKRVMAKKAAKTVKVKEERAEPSARSTKKSREAVANVYSQDEIRAAIDDLSRNEAVVGYLKKNVSKRAFDVINKLTTPKTDEALALELDMKINAVRRILNIMQGYGITNYYVAKNVNGWLSFAWYMNLSKLPPFFEYINSIENKKQEVSNECNDYFMCHNCYDATKLIFTFDAAFEEGFKCNGCGKNLAMMDKEQATKLISGIKSTI